MPGGFQTEVLRQCQPVFKRKFYVNASRFSNGCFTSMPAGFQTEVLRQCQPVFKRKFYVNASRFSNGSFTPCKAIQRVDRNTAVSVRRNEVTKGADEPQVKVMLLVLPCFVLSPSDLWPDYRPSPVEIRCKKKNKKKTHTHTSRNYHVHLHSVLLPGTDRHTSLSVDHLIYIAFESCERLM